MFRPMRIVQLGAVMCLLAGCAGPTPKADAHNAESGVGNTSASAEPATPATGHLPDTPAPPAPASIEAGKSSAVASDFVQENGELKADIQHYAAEVARTRNIPQAEVEQLLKRASYDADVARLMAPSKGRIRRSWHTYRKRFVEPVRIRAGLEFWQQNREQLQNVAQAYGVPESIIVAIIGVETIYGRYTGDFLVLDALATLGFRYPDPSRPERSQLFRDQLADLAQLHHQGQLDATTVTGSYAGAMGLPQFMPGSLLRYAVDGDGDGRIDLLNSPSDAIASVASFLRHHGWVPGLPVFAPVELPAQPQKLVTGAIDPALNWTELQQHGAKTQTAASRPEWQKHLMGVVDLIDEPQNTAEYRTGTPNFFAITHYNRSYFYAASVAELASTLAARMPVPN